MANIFQKLGQKLKAPIKDDLGEDYPAIRVHVMKQLTETIVGEEPFYHSYIENIFPTEFYDALRENMLSYKHSDKVQDRLQDNKDFVNQRYNLVDSPDLVIQQFHAIFSDPEIKTAILSKYYIEATPDLINGTRIHDEFEYVFCAADRFQNIHVDIPPKVASFVFYIPEREDITEEEEIQNATILYDRDLKPKYGARFRPNSVCSFVSHFYSYHGFASKTERDVLVMFYIHKGEYEHWKKARSNDKPPYTGVLDAIEAKVKRLPLIEYGTDPERIAAERAACQINAPKGRIMLD